MFKLILLIACAVAIIEAKKCPIHPEMKAKALLCTPNNKDKHCGTDDDVEKFVQEVCLNNTQVVKDIKKSKKFPPLMECFMRDAVVNESHVDTHLLRWRVAATHNVTLMGAMKDLLSGSENAVIEVVGLIEAILDNTLGGQ